MRILMKIVERSKQVKQTEHKGYNRPYIKEGTTVYLIKYVNKNGYFPYGYLSQDTALDVINTMKREGTDTDQYYNFNVTLHPEGVIIKE